MTIYIIAFIVVFSILLFIASKILPKLYSKYVQSDMDRVNNYIASEKYNLAIKKLRDILSKNKSHNKSYKIYKIIGDCYYKMGEYPFAIVEYRHAIDTGDNSPETVISLGRSLNAIGRKEESLAQFLSLLKLGGEYKVNVSIEIGKIYYDNGQYNTAFQFFENALENDSTNKEALKYKAYCYVSAGNYNEAIVIMNGIINKYPNDPALNYNLGCAYKGKLDCKNAIKHYKISSKDREYAIKSLYEIALCYIELNNIEFAIKYLEMAIAYDGIDRELNLAILYQLSECYSRMENLNKAIEYLENIIIIDPNYKDANKKLNEYKESRYSDNIKNFFKLDENDFADLALKIVSSMNLIPYSLKTTDKKYVIIFAKDGKSVHSTKKIVFFRMSYSPIFNEELIQLYDYAVNSNIVNSVLVTCAMATPDAIRYAAMSRIDIVGIKRLENLVEKSTFTSVPVGITRTEEKLDWII